MSKKNNKISIYLYILLIIAGCVLACSSLITNDYLKLIIVMATLCGGLFGVMKGLSKSGNTEEAIEE
ncbi:putative membrane channel-forming protein YqfA (hemolysin III family) [Parabacteroides sp. PFB2-10]|uniref:hypothetical protein n=1 Tax=Parabacteroides sp. PFB2-10 TaxID=1742405 RepID=UPI002473CE77|nr:hypothetical protein [Parabacteroides sp. PFB2-10]MDH6311883.1 putative membrane channel-forming protein YqfA (hemolysin III family) [Parabacteroides sp. PFB2-10]